MWTAVKINFLRACAAKGVSFSEAAAALGTTRNAVAGKARREGIKFSGKPDYVAAAHKQWRTKRNRLARQAKA